MRSGDATQISMITPFGWQAERPPQYRPNRLDQAVWCDDFLFFLFKSQAPAQYPPGVPSAITPAHAMVIQCAEAAFVEWYRQVAPRLPAEWAGLACRRRVGAPRPTHRWGCVRVGQGERVQCRPIYLSICLSTAHQL